LRLHRDHDRGDPPEGTDLIIPYEQCTIGNGIATVKADSAVRGGQFVHPRGADCLAGDLLIPEGRRITREWWGQSPPVGLDKVPVRMLPRVAVCASGNELVDITDTPEAHQIRRSNSYMLAAALREEGILADTYYLPDDQELMKDTLGRLLPQYEVLLFSGAVSKGRFDFLPAVLDELGMRTVFHGVAQKPGKPLLFGTFDQGTVVFGLPGNPASTMVCYGVFFKSWLNRSLNYKSIRHSAQLTEDVVFRLR
jgi:molybdopterin molybdotransferase